MQNTFFLLDVVKEMKLLFYMLEVQYISIQLRQYSNYKVFLMVFIPVVADIE